MAGKFVILTAESRNITLPLMFFFSLPHNRAHARENPMDYQVISLR
jgi:hypothetical protein